MFLLVTKMDVYELILRYVMYNWYFIIVITRDFVYKLIRCHAISRPLVVI